MLDFKCYLLCHQQLHQEISKVGLPAFPVLSTIVDVTGAKVPWMQKTLM
jgi:hypothetical protein